MRPVSPPPPTTAPTPAPTAAPARLAEATGAARPVTATGGRRPLAMVVLGVVVFSTGPVIVAGASASGTVFSFWRLWMGAALLGTATLVVRHRTGRRTPLRAWPLALAAGVAFGLHQVMLVTAVQLTSVVDVTLMNTVTPVVVGVLAVPLFGERPGAGFRLWSALAMVGAGAVAVSGSTGPRAHPAGMALAAANVVAYALFFVVSKVARPRIEPLRFLFGAMTAAAVTVSALAAVTRQAVLPMSAEDLVRCLAVAALPGFVGHLAVTWALRWVPANVPPVLMLAIPVLSGATAWVALGQAVRPAQLAVGALTLAGVAGAVRASSATTGRARPAGRPTEEVVALALAEET